MYREENIMRMSCVCVCFVLIFCVFLSNKYPHLFPLVGGGNIPASPSTLISGLSSYIDDNDFEIIKSPISEKEFSQFNNDIDDDDEKASTIIESEDTNDNDSPRIRHNSIPTPLSTFKTAVFNGISVEKKTIKASNQFFFFTKHQPVCSLLSIYFNH